MPCLLRGVLAKMAGQKDKRLTYVVPQGLDDKIRQFAYDNEFRNEREAMSALIEGALEAYPKWGVRKGIARVASAAVRGAVRIKVIHALGQIAQELEDEMSGSPSAEDMEVDPNAGFIE